MICEHLERFSVFGIRPGLERITSLLRLMGNPEKDLNFIHVAGTNGKGSVSFITASLLSASGYRTGRFSSPHLHSYLERFTVDGQEIEAEQFMKYLDYIQGRIDIMTSRGEEHPTEFEVLTALAFQYFKDSNVDIAVIEVGLGGVYDSTNVILPLVSVITGIDYDHTAVLGTTLEAIAENKAGIIKAEIPLVMGTAEKEALRVIEKKAALENAPVFDLNTIQIKRNRLDKKGQDIDINFGGKEFSNVHFGLLGDYQLDNLRISLGVVRVLEGYGYNIPFQDIIDVLMQIKFPGRMEIVSEDPLVIVDAGHNPQAALALSRSLKSILPGRNKVLVCGYLDDKDAEAAISYLGAETSKCVVSRPEGNRTEKWDRVGSIWNRIYPEIECYMKENIEDAVKTGLELLLDDEYLLITGSFYLIDRARRRFTNT